MKLLKRKKEINLPNYEDGSIVNLVSSISAAFGGKPLYQPLRCLEPNKLTNYDNIVLMVIDGLGYEYINNQEDSLLKSNLKERITSVFPSTTAVAITSFNTAVAPKQHAITGWFTYLNEINKVSTIIKFISREDKVPLEKCGIKTKDIFDTPPFTEKLNIDSYLLTNSALSDSDYTRAFAGESKIYSYQHLKAFFRYVTLDDYFKKMGSIIKTNNAKKFLFAYWGNFDHQGHKHGVNSKEAKNHYGEINSGLERFLKTVDNTSTLFIITADHGMIDNTENETIHLEDHPYLRETLSQPLSGEPRVAYCYVKNNLKRQFKRYVKKELKNFCTLHKSTDLVRKNFFGLYEPNKKLFERIGDYTLIMKDNYTIRDLLKGEEYNKLIGNHGGVSKEEMYVPLILIEK